jgi:DUF4097 and DUF4098 domain-containing protein YvlB
MKTRIFTPIATLVALLMAGAALASAQELGSRAKSFPVSKGGTVEVSTGNGDIRVQAWNKNEVYVDVEGVDPDELDRLEMKQSGNTVLVKFRPRWRSGSDVRFNVSIPSEFNLELRTSGGDIGIKGAVKGKLKGSTSGGDIRLENVDGMIEMTTSGGDVECGIVQGDATLKTSGGDIRLERASGDVQVATSGGDIRVGDVGKSLKARTSGGDIVIGDVGGEVNASTAGGDIQVGKVTGRAVLSTAGGDIKLKSASGTVEVKTAGGDLDLRGVTGSIEGKTAGGNIVAELTPSGKGRSALKTAGGSIRLYIAETAKATIEATIEVRDWGGKSRDYDVRSDFEMKSYKKEKDGDLIEAVIELNGGGEVVTLETVNSNIEVRKLRK